MGLQEQKDLKEEMRTVGIPGRELQWQRRKKGTGLWLGAKKNRKSNGRSFQGPLQGTPSFRRSAVSPCGETRRNGTAGGGPVGKQGREEEEHKIHKQKLVLPHR